MRTPLRCRSPKQPTPISVIYTRKVRTTAAVTIRTHRLVYRSDREKTETPRKAQVDTHSPDLVRHRRDRSPQPFVKSKDRRRPPIQRPTDGSCNPPRASRGDVSAGVLKVPRQIIEPRLWSGGAPRRHATDATGPAVVSQPSSAAYAACVEADGPMPSSSRSSTRKCSYTRNASAVLPSAESARMRSPAAACASSRRSRDRARCRPHC